MLLRWFKQQIQLKSNQEQKAESNINRAQFCGAVSYTSWTLPFKTWGRAKKGSLPGQQNVIGLKLAQELIETKAITEANSIWGLMAHSSQAALLPTETLQKHSSFSSRETWFCQHSFIFTADQPDHTETPYYTSVRASVYSNVQPGWVSIMQYMLIAEQ